MIPVYEYFQNLAFTGTHSEPPGEIPTLIEDTFIDLQYGDIDHRVIDFLNSIDTGICGFRRKLTLFSKRMPFSEHDIGERHDAFVEPSEFATGDVRKIEELVLVHRGKDGKEVCFALDLESSGTRRMLTILGKVFVAIDEGSPVFVDELDMSLHSAASEAVLHLFCSRELNRNGAQLLATVHDTSLIKSGFLRRDQIWFAEKDRGGSTEIYPLTDFRTRKDDSIELGYRQGRYGAVPTGDPVASLLES
ncbi:MAG: AAA family ATPase [Gammaproteobacteria bacterium]|nr:AAA family ATPase [Gammaproteobacteria bacterium]